MVRMMWNACGSPGTLVGAGRARESARGLGRRWRLAASLLVALATPGAARGATHAPQASCDGSAQANEPSRDLYCIELFPASGMERASGRVELGLGAGPFTIAATAEGALRYAPTITLAGLPAPSSLGPYAVYVVWAATPAMDRVRRLGVATAGRTRLDAIDFDKFVILVSAERSANSRTSSISAFRSLATISAVTFPPNRSRKFYVLVPIGLDAGTACGSSGENCLSGHIPPSTGVVPERLSKLSEEARKIGEWAGSRYPAFKRN